MKYAIMSDVHANPMALDVVLSDARKLGCTKFLLLGDITGYGYDAQTALEMARENFDVVLMGNHDSACVGFEPPIETMINPNYDLDRAAGDAFSKEDRQWLRSRDYLFEGKDFACAHGDFTCPKAWNYIVGMNAVIQNFFSRSETLLFCGHTHAAEIFEAQMAKGVFGPKFEEKFQRPAIKPESISFKVSAQRRYIVNVGSVGYPRHDLCSSYGIYDEARQRVTLRRLPFDFQGYIRQMQAHGIELPMWLLRLLRNVGIRK